jgi:hypothetical protein
MSFSYDLVTPTDVTRVRRHISDTEEATAIYSDEEISFILSEEGTVAKTVIACIKQVIAKLAAEPNMKADWLQIDWASAIAAWKGLLAEKKQEFGLGWQSSSGGQHSYRPDTLQKVEPDYGEE